MMGGSSTVGDLLKHHPLGFSSRMCKHFADLRISPLTRDLRHEAGEAFGITNPLARTSFSISAKVDELHV
jgi:hypothetical protein